jgi:hypothetical protein
MGKQIETGAQVTFQYRKPACMGGEMVRGAGVVIGQTIVGSDDAYIIKPTQGDCVHVRAARVWAQ